jgi:cytochrome c peroxidase
MALIVLGISALPGETSHDNPSAALRTRQAALGRYLFYDKRLSGNGTYSCASCHKQELAFTDGRAQALGSTGQLHPRSALSLVNLASATAFNWADPTVHSLEQQALKPMYGTQPVEMGVDETRLIQLIETDPLYRPLFAQAFTDPAPFTVQDVAKALAAFERTIVSYRSPYDRYHLGGDRGAISDAAKRGEMLFFLDGPSCFRCHGGPDFSGRARDEFHNTALYNNPGPYAFPAPNFGLYSYTKRPADMGKFKAPTLRNIALTAPYMHDGSIATLDLVLDHYAAGGRAHDNTRKDKLMTGFDLTPRNRADLIAFLESLTDLSLIHDPALSDPWPEARGNQR